MNNISTQIHHAKCYLTVKRNIAITPAMERSGVTYGLKRVRVEATVTGLGRIIACSGNIQSLTNTECKDIQL